MMDESAGSGMTQQHYLTAAICAHFWGLRVCDFNLSKIVEEGGGGAASSVAAVTNPRWLAPEVLAGGSHSKCSVS